MKTPAVSVASAGKVSMRPMVRVPSVLLAAATLFVAIAPAFAAVLEIDVAPPPSRAVAVPSPRAGFVWAPGYYRWDGHRHVWVDGHWIRERHGFHWIPERWEKHHGHYRFEPGHWDKD